MLIMHFKPSNSKNTQKLNIFQKVKNTRDKQNVAYKKLLKK